MSLFVDGVAVEDLGLVITIGIVGVVQEVLVWEDLDLKQQKRLF